MLDDAEGNRCRKCETTRGLERGETVPDKPCVEFSTADSYIERANFGNLHALTGPYLGNRIININSQTLNAPALQNARKRKFPTVLNYFRATERARCVGRMETLRHLSPAIRHPGEKFFAKNVEYSRRETNNKYQIVAMAIKRDHGVYLV